jgi:hypothetical protein
MRTIGFGLILLNVLLLCPAVGLTETTIQLADKFSSEKIGRMARSSTVAGTWRGEWSNAKGHLYSFEARLTVSSDNNVTGAINWKLVASPRGDEQSKLGMTATEYIGGTYDPKERLANIEGHSKDDPKGVIGLDAYRIVVAEDGRTITGNTRSHGTWKGKISGKRVMNQ